MIPRLSEALSMFVLGVGQAIGAPVSAEANPISGTSPGTFLHSRSPRLLSGQDRLECSRQQ